MFLFQGFYKSICTYEVSQEMEIKSGTKFLIKMGPERAGRVAQVVAYLPTKCEAVNSNPISPQRKKERKMGPGDFC
jgi:hypothetical protein